MFWMFTGIIGFSLILVWNIFVHPIGTVTALLKLALGACGILCLLAGLLAGHGVNIFVGVVMLVVASAVGFLQRSRSV
jgi:hypothetical protein